MLLNLSGSKLYSEQECERKLHSTISKLKTTLERSKLYNKERIYLKIYTFPEKTKKNEAKFPTEVLTTQSSKQNGTENTDLRCQISKLSACTKQFKYTKDTLELEEIPHLPLTCSPSPSSGSCDSTSLCDLSAHQSKTYKKRRIQCDYYKKPAIKG